MVIRKIKIVVGIMLLVMGIGCKTQITEKKAPFTIKDKSFFYFEDSEKGTKGVEIRIVGHATTSNLSFSKVYFKNRVFEIAPLINVNNFTLAGRSTALTKPEMNIDGDAAKEYGNQAPKVSKNIPFDLKDNEALIVYSVNGEDFYYKVTDMVQLDSVIK